MLVANPYYNSTPSPLPSSFGQILSPQLLGFPNSPEFVEGIEALLYPSGTPIDRQPNTTLPTTKQIQESVRALDEEGIIEGNSIIICVVHLVLEN